MQVGDVGVKKPELQSVLNPLRGSKRWLIAFCCFLINLGNTLAISMVVMAKGYPYSWGLGKKDEIIQAYAIVLKFGVPVAALLMIWVGYRITALVGGVMVGASLLVTSFLEKDDVDTTYFLVAGVAGAGSAFLKLSAIVPVLEYFMENRILGVVFVYFGQVFGVVIALFVVYGENLGIDVMKDLNLNWETLYKYQLIPIGVSIISAFVLTPLDLRLGEGNPSVIKKILGVSSWKQLRGFLLAGLLIMVFLCTYGKNVTQVTQVAGERNRDFEGRGKLIAALSPPIGQFAGIIVLLCFWKRQQPMVFIVLAAVCLFAGLVGCAAPAFKPFELTLTFGVAFGFAQSLFDNILNNMVPKTFGRQHIRIVEGLIGLATGLGSVASTRA